MTTAFQQSAFQNNAFQIDAGIQYLGGDDTKYPWDKPVRPHKQAKKREYEVASELIDRVVTSFTLAPEHKVEMASSAVKQISTLSIPDTYKPSFSMTETHVKAIQKAVVLEIKRIETEEEDEFMFLLSHLV